MKISKISNIVTRAYILGVVPMLGLLLDGLATLNFDYQSLKIISIILKDGVLIVAVVMAAFASFTTRRLTQTFRLTFPIVLLVSYFGLRILIAPPASSDTELAAFRNYCLYPLTFLIAAIYAQLNNGYTRLDVKLFWAAISLNLILAVSQFLEFIPSAFASLGAVSEGTFVLVHGGFNSYIELSAALAFSALVIASGSRRSHAPSLVVVFLLVATLVVILSQSRTGLVAMICTSLVVIRNQLSYYRSLFIIIIFLIGLTLYYSDGILNRIFLTTEDPRFSRIWPFAISVIAQNPLTGSGVGSFGSATSAGNDGMTGMEYLDSSLLSIFVQTGVTGFLLYLSILFFYICSILRSAWRVGLSSVARAHIAAVLVTFGYSALFNFLDGWPGAIFAFGWLGYFYSLLKLRCRTFKARPISVSSLGTRESMFAR